MNNRIDLCRKLVRRLWFQLAVSYTLLAFLAMLMLVIILYGLSDYSDFHSTRTLETIERTVAAERRVTEQAILNASQQNWLAEAADEIRDSLVNMEQGTGPSIYRITNSSNPEAYIRILDRQGNVLLSDPESMPKDISERFRQQSEKTPGKDRVVWLDNQGTAWIDFPILDGEQKIVGRLNILFIARFSPWVQIRSVVDFLLFTWSYVFALSVPIGISCGLLASRYVKRQLQKINEVTEKWREGDFSSRIALNSDDVLARHGDHLNGMAHDLEMFVHLRQDLAISNERTRVARELHDTVKQKLFALGLQLATVKSKPVAMEVAGEHVREAETITREAQHDLMEIITQLQPAEINPTSLPERIRLVAEDFVRRFDVQIDLNLKKLDRFHPGTEHHVMRIIHEALMNAVKHGRASRLAISSGIDTDRIVVVIEDNGTGFDVEKVSGGMGLGFMKDRAGDLPDGRLDIDSSRMSGTTIRLSWKRLDDE
ncbi:sensor histidine kinase [uncultured Cohaesibacter sp.]|uniref:sensor histidine kinase n=1 Tax=uncultured Cohaesibacter sp. TaxID=1002546 RepID=UPI0029C96554|nr:sensor histidine kinase [uncultured Cohaesibacter sp.]